MHVSVIEVLFTAIATIGFLFSLYNFSEAFLDALYLAQHKIVNGRQVLAKSSGVTSGLRAVVQAIFMAVGITYMFIPGIPSNVELSAAQETVRLLASYGFVTAALATAVSEIILFRVRRQLVK